MKEPNDKPSRSDLAPIGSNGGDSKKGVIAWFATNGVSANLIMFVLIALGLLAIPGIKKEIFPEFEADILTVTVPYRGAAPEEVEEGVCVRIEEAIQDLDGIKKITSNAGEGSGTVIVEVVAGYDQRKLLDEVKSRVDAIDTFPEETEKPVTESVLMRRQVINISLSGDADEKTLKRLGEQVRDEVMELDGVTQADVTNARAYEISIEVSEDALRRHGLTFDQVASAVRRSSLDLPGGSIKTTAGEILLRTKGQAYSGSEFERLTLLTKPDGTKLLMEDVATVVDGFTDVDRWSRFDGKPSVLVRVYRVGDQNALEVAAIVHEYVAEAKNKMPEGIAMEVWRDDSIFLAGRLDLMLRNAASGLILVFAVLALFLRMRLAFWVTLGIPISFLGAIALMPVFESSINMISLFAFILVLGIVVDDAIIVGESIFTRQEAGDEGVKGSIKGTTRVGIPVIFGVLTTVAAFSPMMFIPGFMGKIWRMIPLVVIPTLIFSLIESQLVLPYHLSHHKNKPKQRKRNIIVRIWDGFFGFFSNGLVWLINNTYKPTLHFALQWRYLTVSIALCTMLFTVGLVGGGFVPFVFFPNVEGDFLVGLVTMPQETPVESTERAVKQIETAAMKLRAELAEGYPDQVVIKHMLATVGGQPFTTERSQNTGALVGDASSAHLGEVGIELVPSEDRSVTSEALANRWRELTGPIPGAVEVKFSSDLLSSGADVDLQLRGPDTEALRRVAEQTKAKLAEYPGVYDITDSFRGGKPEIKLALTSRAEALGLSLEDLARQVRQGFYGEEAQRIQRGRDDVRVMVRYPKDARRSLGDLEQMRIRTPSGDEVPFSTVAVASHGRGFANIKRVDRQRAINVTAEVDPAVNNDNEVLADLEANFLNPIITENPGMSFTREGQQREQMESMSTLAVGFAIALFVIYALMAIPFKSYLQPAIVMTAVPFGVVGAIWGHVIMDFPLSMMSSMGVVALAGIVVNDSLVLVNFVNRRRGQGLPLFDAVREAGGARFRAILLTSLTTAAGVTPLMLEKSVQAKFLVPMAVSLSFGVMFSTFITLLIVPCSYLILEDIKRAFTGLGRFLRWVYAPQPEVATVGGSTSIFPSSRELDHATGANGSGRVGDPRPHRLPEPERAPSGD